MIKLNSCVHFVLVALASSLMANGAEPLSFNRDIRPILSENCFSCHGIDAKHRKGKLRLDEPKFAYGKGKSDFVAIVPGKPEESEVWLRIIAEEDDDPMPPKKSKKNLTKEQKEILRRWIAEGAKYQKHWAFEAPVAETDTGGIDHFIDAELNKKGVKSTAEADRSTLIRRAAFTLTGLPAAPEELDAFLKDQQPGAYGRMVDRYLGSQHFGEEMARHWLDVARYGDTHGMHLDNERQMFAYRDWVVNAFNVNQPFDQFTIEQIAGDLLPKPAVNQLVATGFNRCNITTAEGGSIAAEFIYRYAVERASTTAQTWLGLSVGCAVCHDHKFDPISAREFYSFYAFFHSSADPAMDGNALLTRPSIKATPPDYDEKIAAFKRRAEELKTKTEMLASELTYVDPAEKPSASRITETEQLWFEDGFPAGSKVSSLGHALSYASSPAPVFSGDRSLKRSGPGLAQDVCENVTPALPVPSNGKVFVHVYIDPKDPPKEIMIQFFTKGWNHRAIWGEDVIPWGKAGTGKRHRAGDLPKAGEWVRLEVAADKMNLNPGTPVLGYAFTVQDGTAYFDQLGVVGSSNPAEDPTRSYVAWRKLAAGKDTAGVPKDIAGWLKAGPNQERTPDELKRLKSYYLQSICVDTVPRFAEIVKATAAVANERKAYEGSIPSTFIWKDLPKPRESFVMERGAYDKPGEKVEPGTLAILHPLKKADPEGRATRLDLANWLVARENPLTARVTVNRFWQQVFGIGLVKTSHDFGTQGEVPSHPELLDWLAVRFQEDGWDVKKLMRMIVMSDAFRRNGGAPGDLWKNDPENRLLARGPRMRLDAEQLRDAALMAGGLLKRKMGGRGVRTYQPPNIWEPVGFRGSNTANYKRDNGDALYRRSIYTFLKRTAPAPFMSNFDAPNREQSCFRRDRSNTPLQALQLLNDVQFFEAARGLATRMMGAGTDPSARVTFAYRVVLSRLPRAEESALVEAFYQKQLKKYQAAPATAAAAIKFGDSPAPAGVDVPDLAAWTQVANLILNLDENIVRN